MSSLSYGVWCTGYGYGGVIFTYRYSTVQRQRHRGTKKKVVVFCRNTKYVELLVVLIDFIYYQGELWREPPAVLGLVLVPWSWRAYWLTVLPVSCYPGYPGYLVIPGTPNDNTVGRSNQQKYSGKRSVFPQKCKLKSSPLKNYLLLNERYYY